MNQAERKQFALFVAWIASVIATLGSLYFSEIKGFIPCELCWYQRILMYPLTVLLGIATFQNDLTVKKYALPLAIIGWFISVFHYMEQKVPGFAKIKPCAGGVPCSGEYINWLGFVTIPFLALTAFSIIIICLFTIKKSRN
jgi:disulfide bond formation protein DsbB